MYYRMTKDPKKRSDFFKTFLRVGIMLSTTLMGLATIFIYLNLHLSVAIVSVITVAVGMSALLIWIRIWERFPKRKSVET